MLRPLVLLVLLVSTSPLFAQWDMRAGARAGVVQYEAEGFRMNVEQSVPAFGADFWMRRNRFALDLGVDAYQIKPVPGMFWIASADAHLLIGRPNGAHLALGGGPSMISTDGATDFVFSPVVSVVLPAGERQVYALVRWHKSSPDLDRAETTMILFGMRTGRLWRR